MGWPEHAADRPARLQHVRVIYGQPSQAAGPGRCQLQQRLERGRDGLDRGGYAEPYPYITNQWAANNWRTVQNAIGTVGGFHFDGVRTQCNVGDPVTWCPNGNATPIQAWNDLSGATGNNLWPYATNVRTE